ncbi:DUF3035 domain-containing protein [Rhodobacteraceae bacterium CCMM004]|nr:DUF3035 domain-containing protein [Rhodobacteraceae bacterium CCMM004]
MRRGWHMAALATAMALAVAGCSDQPRLLNLTAANDGPDEFGILPTKPLQAPASYNDLPPPTPGQANRTDPTPNADAVAALGGRPSALVGGGLRDPALISHTTRYGVEAGIRQTLAAADLEYRRENDGRLLERLFNVNVYFKAYRPLSLDQYEELERLRRSGVWTPAVPPEGWQDR